MPKLYQAWPGKNRFCCRLITGPLSDFFANMCFYGCVIVVIIPYAIFMFNNIWTVSPAIPILFFAAVALTIVFLNLTSCTDPGIIPRRPFLESQYDKYEKYLRQKEQTMNQIDPRVFCQTCKIFRPPRASHCSTCNNCVEVFDHHCPFVNNCIGKRNYRFFVMFLASVMLTIGTFFLNVIVFALTNTSTQINSQVVIIICSVVVGALAIPLLGFFIFHIYLSCKGTTTREIMKDIQAQKQENQWCQVDPPLIDYYKQISQPELSKLVESIESSTNHSIDRNLRSSISRYQSKVNPQHQVPQRQVLS